MPLSPEAEGAYVAFDALSDHEKRVIVAQVLEANPELLPQHERTKGMLWMTLLVGLFLIAVLSIIVAAVLIVNGVDSAPMLVVVGAVVAGVIGLFSKSPA